MALKFRGLDAPVECVYWKGGSAPVPDPNVQAAADKSTNRFNISGPTGTQSWQQGPQTVQGYGANGQPIYGSTDTQVTTLSPTEQRQFDTSNQIAETMLDAAGNKINDPNGIANTTFSYDQATPQAAQDAYAHQVALLQPTFDNQNKALDQKLANEGLPIGSEAYNEAMRQNSTAQNTALTDAAANSEQQGTQLALSQRQQQYNELASALGGQQVEPVTALSGGAGAPINVASAYNSANQANLANYNAQQASQGQTTAAVGGAASAALAAGVIVF